ncbi:hypothetical protein [Hymenobacter antarcticus]|uniref:Uncharacterized protein n=1 Tax=Hymenobacter antarcticus TaxID=486270 RepID=A0ABP7R4P0_9BACT
MGYLLNLIPKLQQYSDKLDNVALLTRQHWVVIDDETSIKVGYIFRPNGDLLITQGGRVHKAKWEYLGNQSLLVDKGDESYLFKHGFFNEKVLALKVDSTNEYALLVTETEYESGLRTSKDVQRALESFISPGISASARIDGSILEKEPIYINHVLQTEGQEAGGDWSISHALVILALIIVFVGVFLSARN